MTSIRYVVTATLQDKSVLDDYLHWLTHGHVDDVVKKGGALTGEVVVLNDTEVESLFIFPSMEVYEAYCSGVAPVLREEGKKLFVDNGKVVKFERRIGNIAYSC